MEFFLDTGVIFGDCDPKDDHSNECEIFFRKYPMQRYDFYTTKKVKDELKDLKRRRREERPDKIYRKIEQLIERKLDNMEHITDYSKHANFQRIASAIVDIVNRNFPDVKIVTNAIIWSYEYDSLDNPTFVTIDFKDIARNSSEIKKQAGYRASVSFIPLRIETLWDLCD